MAFENAEYKILGRERVEIDPDQLVSEAIQFKNNNDFYSAERVYWNAINCAKNTAKESSITRQAKMGLSSLYSDLGGKLLEAGEHAEAERLLIRSLALDKEMGVDIIHDSSPTIDFLCRAIYKYNTKEKNELADNLWFLDKQNKNLEFTLIALLIVSGFGLISGISFLLIPTIYILYILDAYNKQIHNRGNHNDLWLGLSKTVWIRIVVVTVLFLQIFRISKIMVSILLILWGIIKYLHYRAYSNGEAILDDLINKQNKQFNIL